MSNNGIAIDAYDSARLGCATTSVGGVICWKGNPIALDYSIFASAGCASSFPRVLEKFIDLCASVGAPSMGDISGGGLRVLHGGIIEGKSGWCESHDDGHECIDDSAGAVHRDHSGESSVLPDNLDGRSIGGFGDGVSPDRDAAMRGPNWLRNQDWKKNRKERKLRKKEKKKKEEKFNVAHKGYFSDCTSEVQLELKESRARALIAQNKVDVARHSHKLASAENEINQLRNVAKELGGLVDITKNTSVHGWAKTVYSNGMSSAIEKASSIPGSKVPSLESVEVDDSISCHDNVKNDNVIELSDEEMAYRRDYYALKEHFENLGSYTEVDEFQSYARLFDSYPTVDIKFVPERKFF